MPIFNAPLDNIKFVLHDLLNVEQLSNIPDYEEATRDLINPIIEEGAKLCEQTLFPLNQSGDKEECHFDNGKVTTPKGFKEAYELFTQGGWCGLSSDPKYGGMGMPQIVNTVMQELICASNMSFGMYPGLSQGAYDALYMHGTDELKETYIPKLITGQWSGTMCLTEPHCGTDLGLIKTKALPSDDGSYNITGTKIFISAGEHDLTENIIHLVLARLPDAPKGVKGISLFIVPKYLPDDNNQNNVSCGSIEHKMGIKASSTCVMNFENSKGWLVGKANKGLNAMFTMMNSARLGVAMQGLGIAEVSYQNALAYAKDRLQMRSLTGIKAPDKPADPIIVHPDIRRMLLTMKAFTEGARALSYWTAINLDISLKHPDEKVRKEADDLVALLTPILKAYQTDMGFECANHAIQIHGGHGYISEYGIEQYARDARIAQIYEGTNGIQALDLVGRKLGKDMGRLLRRFFHPVYDYIQKNQSNHELQEFVLPLAKYFAKLQQATAIIAEKGMANPDEAAAASTDYLRMFALVALGYMWVQMVEKAINAKDTGKYSDEFLDAKIHTARFFFSRMLPEADYKFKAILSGAENLMNIKAESF